MREKIWSYGSALVAIVFAAATLPACAQTIGTASTVRNEVVEVRGGASTPISVGDTVSRNEVVRTGTESATKLVFRDDTNLAVGPISTVMLDRFVFSDEGGASKVSVNLVKGAFRFTTGGLEKKAYEIKTPVATIGVRGTVFDVAVSAGRTLVQVDEGQVRACTKSGSQCAIVNAGESVTITATGISRVSPIGSAGSSFAQFCSNDGLCAPTQYASLPSDPGSGGALCGR